MTQLTVSIEDVSMLEQIRQAISSLPGVASVTLKQQAKTGMDRAIEDIKEGRVYEASSVEDLIKQCSPVRVMKVGEERSISPVLRRKIDKARKEYAVGETITCSTPEEMQRYLDSL